MEFNIYRFSKLAVVSFVKKPWDGQKVLNLRYKRGKRDKFNFQVIVLIRRSEKDWPVLEYSIGYK